MAIPLFVKVRPSVARRLGLDRKRFRTADGNYILWQLDFTVFGPPSRLNEYAAAVGGVVLRDAEAAANYRGEVNTPLPEPSSPDWLDTADDGPDPESPGAGSESQAISDSSGDTEEDTAGEGGGDE